jgi:L-erythro-3,5-diaminohexanoate dehydrogenase
MVSEYGLHRVVGEVGVLPQRAQRLDPSLPIRENELLIDVDALNIDAASFEQIRRQASGDSARMAEVIVSIVRTRGKLHNPVTGSGGMLMGRVREVGPHHPAFGQLQPGDRIASLVSLTLTPLWLDEVRAIYASADRVEVRGHAILFATGSYAKIPGDLPEAVVLATLDVCGAPALIARHAKPGMKVVVLGAGKSGALCLAQARQIVGRGGRLIAVDRSADALEELRREGLCDQVVAVDATQPLEVMERIGRATAGTLCALAVNCASAPNTEMATILSVHSGGMAIFFSMATSFTAAALGAEGVAKDITMLIGNGYVPGHADLALDLLRSEPRLRELFERRYAS